MLLSFVSPINVFKVVSILGLYLYSLQDNNFMTSLELAVRFGKTLIIQEMDGVEPVLYPLLRRDLTAQGMHTLTKIIFI